MLSDLRSYLEADSTVDGLLDHATHGFRFYPDRIPDDTPYPVCRYAVIDESMFDTHGADTNKLNSDIIQIDVWGRSAGEVRTIKDAIKDRLASKHQVIQGNTRFGYIEWAGAFSTYESEVELFRQAITINITWSPV